MNLGGYQIIDLRDIELTGKPADSDTGVLSIEIMSEYNKTVLHNNILNAMKYSKKPVLIRGLNLLLEEDASPGKLNPMHEQHITLDWNFGYFSESQESDNGIAVYTFLHPCVLHFYVKDGELIFEGKNRFLSDDSLSQQQADDRYVNVTGDTMTGDLNMSKKNIKTINFLDDVNEIHMSEKNGEITNVKDPVNARDAVNKQWADDEYINASGDTMAGDLSMGGFRIVDMEAPTTDRGATTKIFCDTNYVNVDGDSMTGSLDMGGNTVTNVKNPINDMDVVNKRWSMETLVNVDGDTMAGDLSMGGNHISNVGAWEKPGDVLTDDYFMTKTVKCTDFPGVRSFSIVLAYPKTSGLCQLLYKTQFELIKPTVIKKGINKLDLPQSIIDMNLRPFFMMTSAFLRVDKVQSPIPCFVWAETSPDSNELFYQFLNLEQDVQNVSKIVF